jgi:hypothetical protein
LLELNKIVKVFKDKTPELERAMQLYKEKIDSNNEALQTVIMGTESLRQMRSGETKATPYQYREVLQKIKNQTAQLGLALPERRKDISKAIETGDFSNLEEMVGMANRKANIEFRGLELQTAQQKQFKGPSWWQKQMANVIKMGGGFGAPIGISQRNYNKALISPPKELSPEQQKEISSFVNSFLSQSNLSGENLYSLILKNFQSNPNSNISQLFTSAMNAGNPSDIKKGLLGAVGQTQKEFGLLPSQTKGFIDFINAASDANIMGAVKALESISVLAQTEMMGALNLPKMLKNMEETSIRFEELSSSMDIFLKKIG